MNAPAPAPSAPSPGLVDLLLGERDAADALCADRQSAAALLPQLVAIGAVGVAAWAVVHGGLLVANGAALAPWPLADGPGWWAPIALFVSFEVAFLAAQLVGLPSFYFYGLLAGIHTHGWRIAVESLRARATSAVVLMGLLPVYFAVGLGATLLFDDPGLGASAQAGFVMTLGFVLPFLAGLAAPASLYRAFRGLMPPGPEGQSRRRPMPLLLVFAWSGFFTALAPLGAWRLLTLLSDPSLVPWLR